MKQAPVVDELFSAFNEFTKLQQQFLELCMDLARFESFDFSKLRTTHYELGENKTKFDQLHIKLSQAIAACKDQETKRRLQLLLDISSFSLQAITGREMDLFQRALAGTEKLQWQEAT